MNYATSSVHKALRWGLLPLVLLLSLSYPSQVKGQTCYAETDGNWSNTDIWAPTEGGDPTNNCDGGDGVPGSGETAVIDESVGVPGVEVASNTTVGDLTIQDGSFGVFLNGGNLTVENVAQIGQTTSPSGASLGTFVSQSGAIVDDGVLTIQGSAVVFGTLQTDRESSGAGELNVSGTNGTGNVDIESSGQLRVNQLNGSTSAPISIAGDLTVDGDVSHDVSELSVTGKLALNSGGSVSTNGANLRVDGDADINDTVDLSGGTFDMNGTQLTIDSGTPGTLDLGNGRLEIEGSWTANGGIVQNTGARVVFDGTSTQTLTSSAGAGFDGSNSFKNITVASGAQVNPEVGNVDVEEEFLVKDPGTEGIWGEGSAEGASLTYKGLNFTVEDDGDGSQNFFASTIDFNNTNATKSNPVTASGEVFSEFDLTAGYVQVSTALEVNELFRVSSGTFELVSGGELIPKADVTFNDSLAANGNAVKFLGGTTQIVSGGGPQGGTGLEFGSVVVDSNDTQVLLSQAGQTATTSINNKLTIDQTGPGENSNTNVQFGLDGTTPLIVNGDIENNGTFNPGEGRVTLGASSTQEITTSQVLEFGSLEVSNGGTTLNSADVTVFDTLEVVNGNIAVNDGDRLAIGGEARLATQDDESLFQSGNGRIVFLSDADGGPDNNGLEGYVKYVTSKGNSTLDGQISGRVTFQRELAGPENWYYLSAPAGDSNNDTFQDFLEDEGIEGNNDLRTVGVTGSDNSSFAESNVRLYDETADGPADATDNGWKAIDCSGYSGCVSGMTSQMGSGRGYAVYVYNEDVGTTASTSFPKTITSQVNPTTNTAFQFSASDGSSSNGPGIDATNNEPEGSPIGEEEGWNLLGNPYLTTLDYCSTESDETGMTRGSGISPTVYVWDPVNGAGKTNTSGYASYNCALELGGGSNDSGAPDGGVTLNDGYIAPHQGFFVKATSTSNLNLEVDDIEDAQADTSETFLKSGSVKPPAVQLRFEIDGMNYATGVGFVKSGTDTLDNADGYYSGGPAAESGLSFYSLLSDGTAIATNAMPRDISDKTTVPLKIDGCLGYRLDPTPVSGTATISRSLFRNIPNEWGVSLKDTKTGEAVDLASTSSYSFEYAGECPTSTSKSKTRSAQTMLTPAAPSGVRHSVSKSGDANTRFKLVIDPTGGSGSDDSGSGDDDSGSDDSSGDSTIEFGDFPTIDDNKESSRAKLSLPSADATLSIKLQHKFRKGFETVASVRSTKSTSNSEAYRVEGGTVTIDKSKLEAGTHKYRLKAGDMISDNVAELRVKRTTLTTYPNPLSQGQATVEFVTKQDANVTVTLYNTLGQKVRTLHRGPVDAGDTEKADVNAQSLASGVYFVRMRGDGVMATTRMTVVK